MTERKQTANNKVLLLDTNHPLLEERFAKEGFRCDYYPDLSLEALHNIIGNYSGIILRSRFHLDSALLSKAVQLSFIGRVGAGMEGIDQAFAESKGIRCFNAPEGNRNAVGEHALGMLLTMINRLMIADREVRKGIWKREENRGIELEGKTVGIIGYGNTGGAFARKLAGFGCRVIAYDKYKKGFTDDYAEESSMREVFTESDILSLHVPLSGETSGLVNEAYLQKFIKNIWLINTARGQVVNTADLVEGLKSGKVLGAALDVIEYESLSFENLEGEKLPEPFQYLISSDKAILTPHIAGWTIESKRKLAEVIAGKILGQFRPPLKQ
jgi:D-3-phosphoglycerate dehydrogenase